jgi:hypothetical protein
MNHSAKNPEEKIPSFREKVEQVNDTAFLRGHVVNFVRSEIQAGKMIGPDKWQSNPAEAKKIIEAIFAKFADTKKYPEAAEYQKLYKEKPEDFVKVLGDILVETEMTAQSTKTATQEIKEELSGESTITKSLNRVWKNIEKTSQEGAIGWGKIALFGWIGITLLTESLSLLNPSRYTSKTGKFLAGTANYGVLATAAYGVYDNFLKDPKERGKGTQGFINWARRGMGKEALQPEGEAEATEYLKKNPNLKLDTEATKTFLATAKIPAKDIIHAYRNTEKIYEIDPKKLWEGKSISRKEKGMIKSIDPKKLYALIHGIIHSFEGRATESKMDVLPYVEKEFVEKGDSEHPITFDQMVESAALVTLGVEKPETVIAEKPEAIKEGEKTEVKTAKVEKKLEESKPPAKETKVAEVKPAAIAPKKKIYSGQEFYLASLD